MSRLVYGCRFDLPGSNSWETTIRPRYQRWIADRYRKSFGQSVAVSLTETSTPEALPSGHSLTVKRYEADGFATVLDWSFPGDHGLVWRNLVRTAQLESSCTVEHRVEIGSADYLVAPAPYSVGAPAVVRTLCQTDVLIGDMRIKATVYPLGENGIEQFAALLTSDLRRLPIVLLTPYANGEPNEIDARALADHLAGVAIVTEAADTATTRALSNQLQRLGCYDGAARVYWPGFQLSDDIHQHPLMLGARIATYGPERASRTIERAIFSIAAFRFAPDRRISALITRAEAIARVERAQEVIGQGDTTWEAYALEMSEKLDSAEAERDTLKAENENLRANQSVLLAFSEAEDEIDDIPAPGDRTPTSVLEAVEFAAKDSGALIVLDSALASAADSPFKRPHDIYSALEIMNKVAEVWAKNEGSGDLRLMLKEAGLGKRVSNFISQTSKGKWGDEYTFIYNGEPTLFESHVTLGAGAADTCASIHFLPDPGAGKIVVAHVGRHLTNTRA